MSSSTGLEYVYQGYKQFIERNADPRTTHWPLMESPGPVLMILVTYIFVCTKAGPRYMQNRKPYKLTEVLIVYNFLQVIINAWLFYEGLSAGWFNDYSYKCQPVDYSNSLKAVRMASLVWYYLIVKLVDLLDTIFFVLRKKNNHVSWLHLYHHSLMPVCGWIGTKFLAGGHGTFLGVINTFVHVIMYTYYMIAAMGPEYQKYLWWKKYLTRIQLVQFGMVMLHQCQIVFFDCNYPKTIAYLLISQALYFMYLFGSFYMRTYVPNDKRPIKEPKKVD